MTVLKDAPPEESAVKGTPVKVETLPIYSVKLPEFEGPMDLLLHLIKKNEMNITDIKISLITRQYLEFLDLLKSMNLSVAGEFLVLAATLIHIKSKMLLPPEAKEEEEEEVGDPRAELVMRLLEYQRYKEAAGKLADRELDWRDVFDRPPTTGMGGKSDDINLVDVSLFDLLEALQGVMKKTPGRKSIEIVVDELTVQDRIGLILDKLEEQESVTFLSLFEGTLTRESIVVTLLAVLELVKLRRIRIQQPEHFGAIRIWKTTNSPQ